MFRRMLDHPRIRVRLGTDFDDLRRSLPPPRATVYCGPLDEYFDHRFGKLPWRSLHFEHVVRDVELSQPCVQINFPDRRSYTRTVEIKHVTGQRHPETVVTYEHPRAARRALLPGSGPREPGALRALPRARAKGGARAQCLLHRPHGDLPLHEQ